MFLGHLTSDRRYLGSAAGTWRVGRGKTWLERSGWSSRVDELRSPQLLIHHVRWELQSDGLEPFADWLKRSETRITPLQQTIRVL